MGRCTAVASTLLATMLVGACTAAPGPAPAAPAAQPVASTATSLSATQVLQVLQAAGLCRDPEVTPAQVATDTQFGHPASTTCRHPGTSIEESVVILDGVVQPLHRARMARQLTEQHIHVYVHDADDPWLLVVPEARDAATRAAFGDQITPAPVLR